MIEQTQSAHEARVGGIRWRRASLAAAAGAWLLVAGGLATIGTEVTHTARLDTYMALIQALAIAVVATVVPMCTPTRQERTDAEHCSRTAAVLLITLRANSATIDDLDEDHPEHCYRGRHVWHIAGAISVGAWTIGIVLATLAAGGQMRTGFFPLASMDAASDVVGAAAALLCLIGSRNAALRREWHTTVRHLDHALAAAAATAELPGARLHLVPEHTEQARGIASAHTSLLGKRAE